MYDEPFATPNAMCDVHVKLDLTIKGNKATAEVSNALDGYCELYVAPNPRTYNLKKSGENCGSIIYKNATGDVTLTDNSFRLCEDVIPGLIVLEEEGQTLYSKDY